MGHTDAQPWVQSLPGLRRGVPRTTSHAGHVTSVMLAGPRGAPSGHSTPQAAKVALLLR